ncbi:FAR1-related protein, partial [Trifolium medium]|nr:FAR1-related protein [Trifolium medium]
MDDECKPADESRAVVLAIPRQDAVCDANPINCQAPEIVIDTSSHFVTEKTYKNLDDLIDWAKKQAYNLQFSIVIERSDNSGDRRKPVFVLDCERGGVYKQPKKKAKFEEMGSR